MPSAGDETGAEAGADAGDETGGGADTAFPFLRYCFLRVPVFPLPSFGQRPWPADPPAAAQLQRELAPQVVRAAPAGFAPRFVTGVDAAFPRRAGRAERECAAAAVVWDLRERRVVEELVARTPLTFPYVPGLLSFREGPAVLEVLSRLRSGVECLLCDGQGRAHPRRFGLACHLGLLLGVPSVGCAKSRLVGEARDPGPRRGDRAPLEHRGERVGTVLRTRDRVRPVFVSPGHLMDLPTAERIVLAAGGGYRLPEPTRRADALLAGRGRRPAGTDAGIRG